MTDFASAFSTARLSRGAKPIEKQEIETILAGVRAQVAALGASGQGSLCLLSDADGLRFALSYFALLDAGHTPIPVSSELSDFQTRNLTASFPEAAWMVAGVLAPSSRDLPTGSRARAQTYACLTSGTTGISRPCFLTVEGARANARAHAESFGIDAGKTLVQSLPVHHSFGIVCYLWTVLETGAALDLNPVFLGARALKRRNLADTIIHLSPGQVRFMVKEAAKGALKDGDIISGERLTLSVGGGLIEASEIRALRKLFPAARTLVSYGLTEAGPRVTTGEHDGSQAGGFIGRAMPGVELCVEELREEGKADLRVFGEGVLCVRSPSVQLGAELLSGDWLRTRDRVRLDPSGDVYFLAREQDLIKVGGVSVYPREIELACRAHDAVKDCVVLKEPHPVYEEVPILFVEAAAESGLAAEELDAFLRERLSPSQLPRRTTILEKLPRHSLNKVDRRALRELEGALV